MSKALSLDLRQRTLAVLHEEGLTHREAPARFKFGAASVSRWRALAAEGSVPLRGPLGGVRRSHMVEAASETILEVFRARRDMTLSERGLRFGYGKRWRFFDRRSYTRKKDRPRARTS